MRFLLLLIFVFIRFLSNSQCDVTITASTTVVPCGGGPVTLTANGSGFSTVLLDNDFDGGTAGPGWNVSPAGQFNNPCDPSVDGGTYMWMGSSTAAPRTLETVGMDLSCGGDVCFLLDYSTQGGASPCEGPDLTNEGVYFEYSIDGGASWLTIEYFEPNTTGCINANNAGSGCDGNYTAWGEFCYPIPAGAQTTNTIFHWFQDGSSGTTNDHWGIDNVTITAQGCGSAYYDWDNIPGTVGPAGDPAAQTINVVSDTTLTVCYTDGGGFNCCESVTITVLGMGLPTINATDETCLGDNDGVATITANGGSPNYTFIITSGPSSPSDQNSASAATYNGLIPGNYTVDITDNGGCTVSDAFTINAGPSCCIMTVSSVVVNNACNQVNTSCDGSATANQQDGLGVITYQWFDGGGNPIAGQTAATATGLCAGNYSVEVTDDVPCTITENITITEPTALEFTSVTIDATCGANNGSLTLTASGGTAPYQYSINGGVLQSSGSFPNILGSNYTCLVQDNNGCQYTEVVIVSNSGGQTITSVVLTQPLCNGDLNGTIVINVTGGSSPVTYSINGGATQTSNTFSGLAGNTYNILTEDASGCQAADIGVLIDPDPIAYAVNGVDLDCYQVCIGELDVLNITGGDGTYQYSNDAGVSFGAVSTFSNLCAGNYEIQVQDGNGCTVISPEVISEPVELTWAFTFSNPTCFGGIDGWANVIPEGGSVTAGYIHNWTPSSIASTSTPFAQNIPSGNYSLTVLDDNGCQLQTSFTLVDPTQILIDNVTIIDEACAGDCAGSLDIAAGNAIDFEINGPGGSVNNGIGMFSNLCAGSYDITVLDINNCPAIQTVLISAQNPINITTSNDTIICIGGTASVSANANGGVGALTYVWDNGLPSLTANNVSPSSTTTYSVYAEDANGCVSSIESIVVSLNPALSVSAFSDQSICEGENASISALANGGNGGPYTYSWDQGIGSGGMQTVAPSVTTTYTVTANDGCETPAASASITITVNLLPSPSFTPNLTDGCVPLDVEFTETVSVAGYSCYWDFGDGNVSTDCGIVSHQFTSTGCYDVELTLTSVEGCLNTIAYPSLVCVHEYPVPDFEFGPQPTTFVESTISFTNTSSANATDFLWEFGDMGMLGTENSVNSSFTFDNQVPGTYPVCLTATTQYGCSADTCNTVVIDDVFLIYVPNSFTVDGDGLNEEFFPVISGYDPLSYHMYIFNRWGELIWETGYSNPKWDGTDQKSGVISQTDVYVWKIILKDKTSGDQKEFIGHVTLLR